MSALKAANLGLAFLLELVALASFAFWGFTATDTTTLNVVLGIGVPIVAIVLWGFFAAPQSERRLRGTPYLIFKLAFFTLAIVALYLAGSTTLALIFAVVFALNTALIYAWHQE